MKPSSSATLNYIHISSVPSLSLHTPCIALERVILRLLAVLSSGGMEHQALLGHKYLPISDQDQTIFGEIREENR